MEAQFRNVTDGLWEQIEDTSCAPLLEASVAGRARAELPGQGLPRVPASALSGPTRSANRSLRQALVESARGAVGERDCYLAAHYRGSSSGAATRRPSSPWPTASSSSPTICSATHHQLYRELGGHYFDR